MLFVASEEASFSTGSEFIADGGLLLARCRSRTTPRWPEPHGD